MLRRLLDESRAMSLREAVKEVAAAFDRNDLLTFASALAFRIAFALIPLALFALALMAAFGMSDVWSQQWAPSLAPHMSSSAFQLLTQTVDKVLSGKQLFWLTLGAGITVWE